MLLFSDPFFYSHVLTEQHCVLQQLGDMWVYGPLVYGPSAVKEKNVADLRTSRTEDVCNHRKTQM